MQALNLESLHEGYNIYSLIFIVAFVIALLIDIFFEPCLRNVSVNYDYAGAEEIVPVHNFPFAIYDRKDF